MSYLGLTWIILYCLSTAFSVVFISSVEQTIAPITVVFYSFFFAQVFFLITSIPKWKKSIRLIQEHRKLMVKLNLSTVFNWALLFVTLKVIEPTTAISIYMGLRPITTLLFTEKKNLFLKKHLADLFFTLAIFLILALFVSHQIQSAREFFYMFLAGVAAGAGSLTAIYAHDFILKGATPSQVLSTRFTLLVVITLGLQFFFSPQFFIGGVLFFKLFSVTLVSLIFPMYVLQRSLEKLGPLLVSYFSSSIPIFAYLMQIAYFREQIEYRSFFLVTLLSCTLFLSIYKKRR